MEKEKSKIELEKEILELKLTIENKNLQIAEKSLSNFKNNKTNILKNPLLLGIFVALIGLAGNIIITLMNGENENQLKQKEFESALILEAVKTGDLEEARENLGFFIKAGFLTTNKDSLDKILRNNEYVPVFTPNNGNKLKKEVKGVSIKELDTNSEIRKIAQSIGWVEKLGGSGILLSNNTILVVDFHLEKNEIYDLEVKFGDYGINNSPKTYKLERQPISTIKFDYMNFLLFKVKGNPNKYHSAFRKGVGSVKVGEPVTLLHIPESIRFISSKGKCLAKENSRIHFTATTTRGSAGGLLLNQKNEIVGIEVEGDGEKSIAIDVKELLTDSSLKKLLK